MPEQTRSQTSQPKVHSKIQQTSSLLQTQSLRRILLIPLLGAVAGIGFYSVVALLTGVWQVLAGAVGLAAGLAVSAVAFRQLRHGRTTQAGYLMLAAAGIAFGTPVSLWEGVTPLLIAGGLLVVVLLANLLLPDRRWRAMLLSGLIYIGYCLFVSLLPLARYDVGQILAIPIFLLGLIAVLIVVLIFQITYTLRFGSIRTRLLTALIVLTLLPVAVVGMTNNLANNANNRQQTFNLLESVAALKEAQVNTWLKQLQIELGDLIDFGQTTSMYRLLLQSSPGSSEFTAARKVLLDRFNSVIEHRRNYGSFSVISQSGNVLISTDQRELAHDYSPDPALTIGLQQTYIAPPVFDQPTNRFRLNIFTPIIDQAGQTLGALVGQADINQLTEIMSERTGLGETGETYLAKTDGAALTLPRYSPTAGTVQSLALTTASATQPTGTGAYTSYYNVPVYGAWRWLPDLQAVMVSEQAQAEVGQVNTEVINLTLLVTLLAVGLASVAALFIARSIAQPIKQLERTAQEVSAGNLQQRAVIVREDEIGLLARTFNSMTEQLQNLIGGLEERVQARTEQLRASAEVGRTVVSVLQVDQLMNEAVQLIAERFDFYYVGLFTLDKTGQYAELRAATGEAGRLLKEQQHKLEVGGQSMVGFATARRRPRIALDVGEDPVRFANPLLPQTRSEIALPLLVGDRVLGALDVQSTAESAFDDTSAVLLQSLADQIAIALNNALAFAAVDAVAQRSHALFAVGRQVSQVRLDLKTLVDTILQTASPGLGIERWWVVTFDAERNNLLSLSTHAWLDATPTLNLLEQSNHLLVRSAVQREQFIVNDPVTDMRLQYLPQNQRAELGKLIVIPLMTHEAAIGALAYGRSRDGADLTEVDLEAANALASLLAVALENQRLYQTVQQTQAELDNLNRRITGESWEAYARRRNRSGVVWFSTGQDYVALPEVNEALNQGHIATQPLGNYDQLGVAVPIVLRGAPLGAFRIVVPQQRWNEEMITTLESIASHVAQAAENVRLLAVTEERFARERALGEATDRVRRRNEIEEILEAAATELARYLNASHIAVQLNPEAELTGGNGQAAKGQAA